MTTVTVSCIQMAMQQQSQANLNRLEALVIEAGARGSQLILMPELPSHYYFCKRQDEQYFSLAETLEQASIIQCIKPLAKRFAAIIPVSFFERKGPCFYNSLAIIDNHGEVIGVYRKSHIPDGIGYMEKYYFKPSSQGFRVWPTPFGCLGLGICWDQWFPEAARAMVLAGAELLLYPSAIGSEPHRPELNSKGHWTRVMQGHSAANMVPLIASNRVGLEKDQDVSINFYGGSFLTSGTGEVLQTAGATEDEVLTQTYNLLTLKKEREAWGLFRDRRPELYHSLIKD